ncbi:hypothetical protein D3C73_1083020 [compost metagenome]
MQIAQSVGVPGALYTLVEAHSPATHPVLRLAKPLCGPADIAFSKARKLSHPLRCVVLKKLRHNLPALGEGGDEIRVAVAVFYQQMQQTIKQGQVAAGSDLQIQVSLVRRAGASRGDHNQLGPGLDPVEHAQKKDGVTVGHIGADHKKHIAVFKVTVRAGWAVGAERLFIAATGAGHAQP